MADTPALTNCCLCPGLFLGRLGNVIAYHGRLPICYLNPSGAKAETATGVSPVARALSRTQPPSIHSTVVLEFDLGTPHRQATIPGSRCWSFPIGSPGRGHSFQFTQLSPFGRACGVRGHELPRQTKASKRPAGVWTVTNPCIFGRSHH